MLNSEKIIEGIRDDAPAVYDILVECYHMNHINIDAGGTVTESEPYPKYPTADQLIEILTEYDGDNWDVHYWSGRYAQMIEQDNKNNTPIRVPLTESDLYDLQKWETFHWSFGWVNLFLFNTDENPELDPDSDEYDPSASIF